MLSRKQTKKAKDKSRLFNKDIENQQNVTSKILR